MTINEEMNLDLWESVGMTDPRYTKSVNDGRHTFTTIEAYYQIEQATKMWGPYGRSWGLEAIDVQFHESLAIMRCVFFYPYGNERTGFEIGNAIRWQSRNGNPDGDFMKKLETDTITKALSRLGFNNDVFMGKFDDNRYVAGVYDEMVYIDRSQVKAINELLEETKTDLAKFNAYFQIDSLGHLQQEDFDKAVAFLSEKKAKAIAAKTEETAKGEPDKKPPRRKVRDQEEKS